MTDRSRVPTPDAKPRTREVPPVVHDVLREPGAPLDAGTRAFFEPRFGADFGDVRVHTGARASSATAAISAAGFAHGQDIVLDDRGSANRHLLAHELAHTIQQGDARDRGEPLSVRTEARAEQEADTAARDVVSTGRRASIGTHSPPAVQPSGSPRYTEPERAAMREGRVRGESGDTELAARFGFQTGDIVFRLGSRPLAAVINNPVTHGGVYLGDGLIHDMVGFGNRTVRASLFYQEAADPNVVKVIRFSGPMSHLIVPKVVANIRSQNFRLPSDPKPWNLFSSADDYRTATCLEYSHAQFLYAIHQLTNDPAVSPADREQLRRVYYAPNASDPRSLIQPQSVTLVGDPNPPRRSDGFGGMGGYELPSSPSAMTQAALLQGGADVMADDIDPTRFENRLEGTYRVHRPEGLLGWLMGPTHDEYTLRTFTYQSFADSRQYFSVIR